MPQHRRLGLDAADTPAHHTKAVDHRRMRVGADERVRIGHRPPVHLLRKHDAREVFEIHLVDNARVGRDDVEIAERTLAPAEEGIALFVA